MSHLACWNSVNYLDESLPLMSKSGLSKASRYVQSDFWDAALDRGVVLKKASGGSHADGVVELVT
jgi:hypothetical protein